MPDMNDLEAQDIEAEIRQRHQPVLHGASPCPSGTCCSCGAAGGCETGTVLVMLDTERKLAALATRLSSLKKGGESGTTTSQSAESSMRVEAITDRGEAFFAWALSYEPQDELLDCRQAVVMAAFNAGYDARWKQDAS